MKTKVQMDIRDIPKRYYKNVVYVELQIFVQLSQSDVMLSQCKPNKTVNHVEAFVAD